VPKAPKMFWGNISFRGVGSLRHPTGMMSTEKFREAFVHGVVKKYNKPSVEGAF